MSADWPVVALSEIVQFSTGKLDSNAAEPQGIYPFFTCSPETLKINKYAFDCEAVLLAGNNANGNFAVKYYKGKFNAYQRTYVITALSKTRVNIKWLYFRIKHVTAELQKMSVGTATKFLTKKILDSYEIELPPESIQEKIADILWSIQNKIDSNTQTNQTLESIAQAIFKSWFVDFEPVKAKMAVLAEGGAREQAELAAMGAISGLSTDGANAGESELAQLQQQNPEHYQQLAETAALFPSSMMESELGEIPEGWEVNNLGVISSLITKGTTPTKSDISSAEDEPKTFFLKVKDIAESGEVIRRGIEKIPTSVSMGALKRSILKTDDVLFSIAGTIGRTAIVDSDLNSANANQALAIIRLSNPKKWLSFTWFNINSDRIQNEIASKVVQGVQANASLANIRDITITMPSDEILEYFNKIIDPILLKKRLLAKNTRELSELRDSLLPKLLSGEIDLSDIQSEVA